MYTHTPKSFDCSRTNKLIKLQARKLKEENKNKTSSI